MRRICYSVAMSLDGYVAGPQGEHDWIIMDPEMDFAALMGRYDAILMGRKTYEASSNMTGSMPRMDVYVVSSTLQQEQHSGVRVLNDQLRSTLERLKREPGKDIWLFGGGGLFRSLLELRLVDAVSVAVIPVLLGSGIPLLPASTTRCSLKLETSRVYRTTGTTVLEYSVA